MRANIRLFPKNRKEVRENLNVGVLFIDLGELIFNLLNILYALALLRTYRKEAALVIFDKIKVTQFDLNLKTQMLEVYEVLTKKFKY